MRNCTQPRPVDHNSKFSPRPLHAPPQYASSVPYTGSGGPPSMYMGVPPYGSSPFNGRSLPPYDVPYAGSSSYPYNYGNRLPGGSPYRPLHLSGPPSFTDGSMIGNGGMYGAPPLLDRYGIGLPPMGHAAMGPDPRYYSDDRPSPLQQGRSGDGTRDNDWTCPQCGNVNFSFRTVCNMRKCNTPKPEPQGLKSGKSSKPDMPEGSWKCEKCNNINYPFRTKCNRKNCGADKPSESNNKSSTEPVDESNQVWLDYAPQTTYHFTDMSISSMLYVLNVTCDPPYLNISAVTFDLLEKLISLVKGFLAIFYQSIELDSFHNCIF
ncbi:hypothetical protein LIER_28434 [Lithospermum erythrorhizon]|uniref:RanBP2-type domain-containing protein n=1 Tax=Lithospermum erythrorhizon TaxID=34254 RepID=A0AAV3RG19_LITER